MQRLMVRVYGVGILALMALALLTSTQVASAHAAVPPNCWQTSYSAGCNRCGFLWLSSHSWHRTDYACVDGYTGSLYESSPCDGKCNP